jgi:AI-2 transport protein TqsA
VQTVCLMILAAVALGAAMAWLRPVLVPFVLAVLFVFCMSGLIEVLVKRLRFSRAASLVITSLAAVLVLTVLGLLLTASVTRLSQGLPGYRARLGELMADAARYVPISDDVLARDAAGRPVLVFPQEWVNRFLAEVIAETTAVLGHGAVIFVFVMFMLAGDTGRRAGPNSLLTRIEQAVRSYLLQMIAVSTVIGVLVGLVMWSLGVSFPLMWGFLAFVLHFIPTLGPIVSTLLPLPVVLLSPELGIVAKCLAIVLPGAIQFGFGHIVLPRLQGHAFDVHPVVVMLSLAFFGMIWGIAGAFLATPLVAIARIALERIPATRSIALLLAGQLQSLDWNEPAEQAAAHGTAPPAAPGQAGPAELPRAAEPTGREHAKRGKR